MISLRSNSVYVSIGALIRLIISLLSIPILVRLLGLERYGIWTVLNSAIALCQLTEFGISTALTKYVSENHARQDWESIKQYIGSSFIIIAILGVTTSVVLWSISPIFIRFIFTTNYERSEASLVIFPLSILIFFRFIQQWAMSLEAAFQRYDIRSMAETASAVLLYLGVIILAFLGHGLGILGFWVLFSSILSIFIHAYFLNLLIKDKWSLQPKFSMTCVHNLMGFGLSHWLTVLGASLFGYADRIIVAYFAGSSMAGIYTAATSVAVQINALSAVPLQVLQPVISEAKALSQQLQLRRIFVQATRINGLIVFVLAAPVIFWATELAEIIVGGEQIQIMADLLRILGCIYGLYSLNASGFFVAIGLGFPFLNARWGLSGGLLALVGLVILTPKWGLYGAAIANGAYVLTIVTNIQVAGKIGVKLVGYINTLIQMLSIIVLWVFISILIAKTNWEMWTRALLFIGLGFGSLICISGTELIGDAVNFLCENISLKIKTNWKA